MANHGRDVVESRAGNNSRLRTVTSMPGGPKGVFGSVVSEMR